MTKKSNTVELVSGFGKIKSCGNPHGSRSDNHTPLRKYRVPDRASSKGRAIRQVEILSNKLLTTAFEASLECVTVM